MFPFTACSASWLRPGLVTPIPTAIQPARSAQQRRPTCETVSRHLLRGDWAWAHVSASCRGSPHGVFFEVHADNRTGTGTLLPPPSRAGAAGGPRRLSTDEATRDVPSDGARSGSPPQFSAASTAARSSGSVKVDTSIGLWGGAPHTSRRQLDLEADQAGPVTPKA